MGEKRITVAQLIEWLEKLPQEAEVCFVPPEMTQGVSRSLKDITVRPINSPSPYVQSEGPLASVLVSLNLE